MTANRKSITHFSGCLIGGAVGDALGAPVEFMSLAEITARFGPNGITNYAEAYGKVGAITDDTQMTLFTAEGLILSRVRNMSASDQIPVSVYHAYLRWLSTQREVGENQLLKQHGTCSMIDGVLISYRDLHSRRAPGNSCLTALASNRMGTIKDPINDSKGCGGIMRIAPGGLFLDPDNVFDVACEIAAITHGHPTGYLAAGCLAQIISGIISGEDLETAIEQAVEILKTKKHNKECLDAIFSARKAWKEKPVSFATVESLGRGWIAEESLAMGIYCALAACDDFEKGICLAVNHGGDSDSTGSITGNILGALLGEESIPSRYTDNLELMDAVKEISGDLFAQR